MKRMKARLLEKLEKCGASVISINGYLGKVIEYDIPIEEDYDVFKMASYYYICDVDPNFGERSLDQYEKDLGFIPIWIDIDKAILTDQMLIDSNKFSRWSPREIFVLEHIKEKFRL